MDAPALCQPPGHCDVSIRRSFAFHCNSFDYKCAHNAYGCPAQIPLLRVYTGSFMCVCQGGPYETGSFSVKDRLLRITLIQQPVCRRTGSRLESRKFHFLTLWVDGRWSNDARNNFFSPEDDLFSRNMAIFFSHFPCAFFIDCAGTFFLLLLPTLQTYLHTRCSVPAANGVSRAVSPAHHPAQPAKPEASALRPKKRRRPATQPGDPLASAVSPGVTAAPDARPKKKKARLAK